MELGRKYPDVFVDALETTARDTFLIVSASATFRISTRQKSSKISSASRVWNLLFPR